MSCAVDVQYWQLPDCKKIKSNKFVMKLQTMNT